MNNNTPRPRRAMREPGMTSNEITLPKTVASTSASSEVGGTAAVSSSPKPTPPPQTGRFSSLVNRDAPSDSPTGEFDIRRLREEEKEWSHLEIRPRPQPKQEALDFVPSQKAAPISAPKATPQAKAPDSVRPMSDKPTPPRPTAAVPASSQGRPIPQPAKAAPVEGKPTGVKPIEAKPTVPRAPKAMTPASAAPKPMELMGVDFEYTYVDAQKDEDFDDTAEFDTDAFTSEEESAGTTAKNVILGITKALIYIVFVLAVSVVGALTVIRCGNDVFAFVKPTNEVTLSIGEYATVDELAELLGTNEVIEYPFVFRLFAKLKKDDGKFVAGTYTVSPSMNYDELLNAFKKKLTKKEEIRLTIPEGYTVDDIIDLFVENGMGTKEGFVEAINEYEYDFWFVKELTDLSPNRKYRLEGYLYPDTYDFYKDWEETVIISRFLANFDRKFSKEYRESCAEQGYTVDDVVNLASIIQMEAKYSDEYAAVSSVLHNRLNSVAVFNRRLDCDATIQYTFDERKPVMEEGDTAIDTPYNTYLYGGLPPGPISNPVMSAVDAALFPDDTNYYYFIAQKNGRLRFAKTLDEHNANVADIKAGN